ncbi:MAG TPA: hypothetical protein VNL15_08050, partial [Dehalococcoidia bacterium]|nr:hypothetical protein [Dehalococcoidia bacterium]
MSTESYRRSRGQPLRAVIEAEVAPAASPRAIEFVHVRRLLAFFPGIWVGGLLALAVLAGAVLRLAYVLPADFPLNDGGLFYVMVRDLQEAHYLLPSFTSYNNADIPFAYPPFSFYLAGLLDDAGPWDLLSIFRFLPLVFSVLTIPAFFWLCRSLFNSSRLDSLSDHRSADTRLVLLATFFFAVMPRSFKWEIVGGGLTRSIGFFLAILFLHQLLMALQSGKKLHTGAAAVLLGLTLLSHPEMSVFAMYSGALFWLFTHRSLQTLWTSALVFVGGFILALPWLIEVIGTHGLGPYLAAMSTGEGVAAPWDRYAFMTFSFSEEPYVPFLAVLGFVGFLSCLAQRKFLLPLWLTLVFVLDARKAPTLAMVPMAMLIAIALDYLAVLSESRLKFDLRRLHRLPRLLGLLPWLLVAPVVALVVLFFLRFDLGLEIATFPAMKWTGILTAAALLPWLAVLIALHQARERAVHALFSPINLLGLALPFLLTPLWFWEMFDFSFRRSCINVLLLAGLGLVGLGSLAIRTFPSWSIRLPGLSLIKVIPVHSVWAVLVLLLVGSYSI